MTTPTGYYNYSRELGYGSPHDRQQWDEFLRRRAELVQQIMRETQSTMKAFGAPATPEPAPGGPMSATTPWTPPTGPLEVMPQAGPAQAIDYGALRSMQTPAQPAAVRPQERDRMIAQARFLEIPEPERMDERALKLEIEERRAGMPQNQEADIGSFAARQLAGAYAWMSTTARILGNVEGAIGKTPFVGPMLGKILGSEAAKNWLWDLSMKGQEFVEAARATQSPGEMAAFNMMTGAGEFAGYIAPGNAAWKAVGAQSGVPIVAGWMSRITNPILRGAVQGTTSGVALEAGSDETLGAKALNIGLGGALGGVEALGGRAAMMALGATIGAAAGAMVGDENERGRNALIGGATGGLMGGALAGAFAKTMRDFPSPYAQKINEAAQDYEFQYGVGGGPIQRPGGGILGQRAPQALPGVEVPEQRMLPSGVRAAQPAPTGSLSPRASEYATSWSERVMSPASIEDMRGFLAEEPEVLEELRQYSQYLRVEQQARLQRVGRGLDPTEQNWLANFDAVVGNGAQPQSGVRALQAGDEVVPLIEGAMSPVRGPQALPGPAPVRGQLMGPLADPWMYEQTSQAADRWASNGGFFGDKTSEWPLTTLPDGSTVWMSPNGIEQYARNPERLVVGIPEHPVPPERQLMAPMSPRTDREYNDVLVDRASVYEVGSMYERNIASMQEALQRFDSSPNDGFIMVDQYDYDGAAYQTWLGRADIERKLQENTQGLASNRIGQVNVERELDALQYQPRQLIDPRELDPPQLRGSKVRGPDGALARVYHGTKAVYDQYDPSKNIEGEELLFGPGYYTTVDPGIASSYAGEPAMRRVWRSDVDVAAARAQLISYIKETVNQLRSDGRPDYETGAEGLNNARIVMERDGSDPIEAIERYVGGQRGVNADQLLDKYTSHEVVRAPNVRPMHLNIENPFDIEKEFTLPEVEELVAQLKERYPGYYWDNSYEILAAEAGLEPVRGEQVYNVLAQTSGIDPHQTVMGRGEQHNLSEWDRGVRPPVGKTGLNAALEAVGYDGITHTGGRWVGNREHQVWIAFKPESIFPAYQVRPLTIQEAYAQAAAMSKQASIMEAETLADHAGRVQLGDAEVVEALRTSNPAGSAVLRGVTQDQPTISRLLHENPDIQFVQREGQLDALIGASPEQAAQYQRTGLYEGMEVVTTAGVEARVLNPASGKRGLVVLQRASGGPPLMMRRDKVLPSRFGVPMREVPDLWPAFKADILRAIADDSLREGLAPPVEITDERVGGLLAHHMEDFMDRLGINNPAERQVVAASFNDRYVQEFRDLDPEARDFQEDMIAWADSETTAREKSDQYLPVSLEEKAESKGFIWLTEPGRGGHLRDALNPESTATIPMESDEAAEAFLDRVDRQAPDTTPITDVPIEVAKHLPVNPAREPVLLPEDRVDALESAVDRMEQEILNWTSPQEIFSRYHAAAAEEALRRGAEGPMAPGGAGGAPPEGPNDWYSQDWFDEGVPQIPASTTNLGQQFRELRNRARTRRDDAVKLSQLESRWQNGLTQFMRYTRYGALSLERRLMKAGIDMGRAWAHVEGLATGRAKSDAEAAPWLEEWGRIVRMFPRRVVRDGSVTRIHEIEDVNARMAAFWRLQESHGLDDSQIRRIIEADEAVTDFMYQWGLKLSGDEAFAMSLDRMIFRYLPHVRARQAAGASNPYEVSGLNPNFEFFAEHAREGNLQFRVMHLGDLGTHVIRAAMFKKHQATAYQQLVDAWHLNRPPGYQSPIPVAMREFMGDYARMSRYGYDASGEKAVKAIKSAFDKVYIKLNTREASAIMGIPQGAMYLAMLGGKAAIHFRDALQILLAAAKVELPYLGGALKDAVGDGRIYKNVKAMYDRGVRGGWIEVENPNLEGAGMWEEAADTGSPELWHMTDTEKRNREWLAKVGDAWASLPDWIARPSQSPLNTLRLYAKQGQAHRMIVGEAGYRQAKHWIDQYRASIIEAAETRDASRAMTWEQLAYKARFTSFGKTVEESPIQRRLKELVDAGHDEQAAEMFGREVANWSQFRYGRKEMPRALRSNFARNAYMFGNFTGQFIEGMVASTRYGTPRDKARYWMTVGGVSAMMYALKESTGWAFDKWAWIGPHGVFSYTGGPIVKWGAKTITALIAAQDVMQDQYPGQAGQGALNEFASDQGGSFLGSFNPYQGHLNSIAGITDALGSPQPVENTSRFLVTGQRAENLDFRRQLEEQARQEREAMERNFQNGTQYYPQGALSPNGGTWQQQTPGTVVQPGVPMPGSGAMP